MSGRPWGGAVALPQGVDPVLAAAARAAVGAYASARAAHTREELAETVAMGADGTPTMRIDVLVESRILEVVGSVNVLSEETGYVDRGSAVTLVMDPLDGSANGAAGVPLTAFSAALAIDGTFTEALTVWTDTGHAWWAHTGTAAFASRTSPLPPTPATPPPSTAHPPSPAAGPAGAAVTSGRAPSSDTGPAGTPGASVRPSSPAAGPAGAVAGGRAPSSDSGPAGAAVTSGRAPSSDSDLAGTPGASVRPSSPAAGPAGAVAGGRAPSPGPGPGGAGGGVGRGVPLGAGPAGVAVACRTSGRSGLDGAAVSLLRPHTGRAGPAAAWWAAASRAGRVRILSSSCLEAALVAEGATDAFADAASDTHRLVDLAAALVLLPAAGGAVRDVFGRPIEFDTDLTRRWSGVVAATPALAEELALTLREAADAFS